MKYLSTLLFALCLGWTWKVIHTQGPVAFNTHAALQSRLAEIIANTIEKMKPESANFKMEYLWTEVLSNGQIKAHFSYKFDEVDSEEDIIENGLEGYAILEREKSVADQEDRWAVVDVKTNTGTLNFREGIVITPDKPQDLINPTPQQESPTPTQQPDPQQQSAPESTELPPEPSSTPIAPGN
jgi:hypothetical protein